MRVLGFEPTRRDGIHRANQRSAREGNCSGAAIVNVGSGKCAFKFFKTPATKEEEIVNWISKVGADRLKRRFEIVKFVSNDEDIYVAVVADVGPIGDRSLAAEGQVGIFAGESSFQLVLYAISSLLKCIWYWHHGHPYKLRWQQNWSECPRKGFAG